MFNRYDYNAKKRIILQEDQLHEDKDTKIYNKLWLLTQKLGIGGKGIFSSAGYVYVVSNGLSLGFCT